MKHDEEHQYVCYQYDSGLESMLKEVVSVLVAQCLSKSILRSSRIFMSHLGVMTMKHLQDIQPSALEMRPC